MNPATQGLKGLLVRIFDEDGDLQAQGLTSEGPAPAEGVFETFLEGEALPGRHYEVQVSRQFPPIRLRSSIAVVL